MLGHGQFTLGHATNPALAVLVRAIVAQRHITAEKLTAASLTVAKAGHKDLALAALATSCGLDFQPWMRGLAVAIRTEKLLALQIAHHALVLNTPLAKRLGLR